MDWKWKIPTRYTYSYHVTDDIIMESEERILLSRQFSVTFIGVKITKFILVHNFLLLGLSCNVTYTSRLTIVSREAKKKQAVRDEQVSYLHVAPL